MSTDAPVTPEGYKAFLRNLKKRIQKVRKYKGYTGRKPRTGEKVRIKPKKPTNQGTIFP